MELFAVARRFKAIYREASGDSITRHDLRRVHHALWGPSLDEKPVVTTRKRREAARVLVPEHDTPTFLRHLAAFRVARARWEELQRERKRRT